MDPGSASQAVQGCPCPGMAERGEENGGSWRRITTWAWKWWL